MTQAGMVLGTAPYMSPEQVEARAVDPRSDIFSLGIVMYEMATGSRPFKGDTPTSLMLSILKDHPSSISEIRRDVPEGVAQLDRALPGKESARPGSDDAGDPDRAEGASPGVGVRRLIQAANVGVRMPLGREPFPDRRPAVSVPHRQHRRGSACRWSDRRHHGGPCALSLSPRRLSARRRGGQGKSGGRAGGGAGWCAISARRRGADGGRRDPCQRPTD